MKRVLPLVLLVAIACPKNASADMKIVTRVSASNGLHKSIRTKYMKGRRQSVEYGPNAKGRVATIYQCDIKKTLDLNWDSRVYATTNLGPDGLPFDRPQIKTSRLQQGPSYHYIITTVDTGERAKVFGFDAWHVRETVLTRSSAAPTTTRTVVDYWYIDLKVSDGCHEWPTDWREAFVASGPRHTLKRIGTAKRGFPVLTRSVTTLGANSTENVIEVLEFSATPLDAALFELPPDFKPALKYGNRVYMNVPDTPANRMEMMWNGFWEGVAKFVY
ncbi:MAG TPA: hypothetical protein VM056_00900 [Terriglobales bacterium]|nr:hypothetical protein [Terriglobales bacterium]